MIKKIIKHPLTKKITFGFAGILLLAGVTMLAIYVIGAMNKPGPYDQFAQCLSDKGTKFYGAFWCPHCQRQKALFGKSAALVPYIECSTPDAKGILPICQEKKIEGFPTWIFADNSRIAGEVDLKKLSEKTSCTLPQ